MRKYTLYILLALLAIGCSDIDTPDQVGVEVEDVSYTHLLSHETIMKHEMRVHL